MHKYRECNDREAVALLAEGVDRNFAMMGGGGLWGSRPPRGGRG